MRTVIRFCVTRSLTHLELQLECLSSPSSNLLLASFLETPQQRVHLLKSSNNPNGSFVFVKVADSLIDRESQYLFVYNRGVPLKLSIETCAHKLAD
jgi:hypothetical protein